MGVVNSAPLPRRRRSPLYGIGDLVLVQNISPTLRFAVPEVVFDVHKETHIYHLKLANHNEELTVTASEASLSLLNRGNVVKESAVPAEPSHIDTCGTRELDRFVKTEDVQPLDIVEISAEAASTNECSLARYRGGSTKSSRSSPSSQELVIGRSDTRPTASPSTSIRIRAIRPRSSS